MRYYKSIEHFSYSDCIKYLKKNEEGQLSTLIRKRKEELLNELEEKDDDLFEKCKTLDNFEEYLKTYANRSDDEDYKGRHCDEAEIKIEDLLFEDYRKSISGCNAYMEKYPQGRHFQEARELALFYTRDRKKKIKIGVVVSVVLTIAILFLNYHPVSKLEIKGPSGQLNQYGEKIELVIETDANPEKIEAKSNEEWIVIDKVYNNIVYATVLPNKNREQKGNIEVKAYGLFFDKKIKPKTEIFQISQRSGYATYMNPITPQSITFDKYGKGKIESISVDCDAVQIEVQCPEWVTCKKASRNIFRIFVDTNNICARNWSIIFSAKPNFKQEVKIRQESGLASYLAFVDDYDNNLELEFSRKGGFEKVKVSTDGTSFSTISSSSCKWMSIIPDVNRNELSISVSENEGEVRTANVIVRSNNGHEAHLTVWQDGEPSNLSAHPSEWRPSANGATYTFSISNDSWYSLAAKSDSYWLTPEVEDNKVVVKCDKNYSEPRKGIVTITCGIRSCEISIMQNGFRNEDCSYCKGRGTKECDRYGTYYDFYGWHREHGLWGDPLCSGCGGKGIVWCNYCNGSRKIKTEVPY